MPTSDPSWPRAADWLARNDRDPELAVVGVPTAASSLSPSEGHRTPAAFREVLSRFSTFAGEPEVDLENLRVNDYGDWPVDGLPAEAAQAEILRRASVLDHTPVWAFIGGDNAITRPLVGGMSGPELDTVGVLTLDAHHDVRHLDDGPNNGTPIRGLLEDGLGDGHVAQVGIHSFANSEIYRRYCERHDVAVFTMATVDDWGIEETVSVALDLLARSCTWIYVDIDIDVLDRAFAPGCPGSRPGGMTPRQLATAAMICGRHPQVRAADFVEVDPATDQGDLTLMNLANTFLAFAAGIEQRPVPVEAPA